MSSEASAAPSPSAGASSTPEAPPTYPDTPRGRIAAYFYSLEADVRPRICLTFNLIDPDYRYFISNAMLDQMREKTNRPTKRELRKNDYEKLWGKYLKSQCVGKDSPYGAPPVNVVSETPGSIDNGLWSIPADYPGGTYSTVAPVAQDCTWLVYRSGTELETVLAGDFAVGGYPTVRLSKGQQFSTSGCGTWSKDFVHPKVSSFSDGVWLVGRDVKPGRYKVESRLRLGEDEGCSWALYRGGTNLNDLLSSDYVRGGRPEVILRNGQEFTTDGCGTWSRRR